MANRTFNEKYALACEALKKANSPQGWGIGNVKTPGLLRERYPVKELSQEDLPYLTLNDNQGEIIKVSFGEYGVSSISFPNSLSRPNRDGFDHDKLKRLTTELVVEK